MRIIVCMRTTVNIDDELLAKARDYTGEQEKTKLLHLGLEALIQRDREAFPSHTPVLFLLAGNAVWAADGFSTPTKYR